MPPAREGRAGPGTQTSLRSLGHDPRISDPLQAAVDRASEAPGFDELLESHLTAWDQLWRRADLEVPGEAGRILRLFHVLQTLSPHTADLDVGVPARSLHGEAYRWHVFWDELFVLPYINLHFPEVSRALLTYRHRRLEQARSAARKAGRAGAMYPWQNGSDGREETQQLEIFFSIVQRKVVSPNDFTDLAEFRERLRGFEDRYSAMAQPFQWRFITSDLDDLLARLDRHTPADRQG